MNTPQYPLPSAPLEVNYQPVPYTVEYKSLAKPVFNQPGIPTLLSGTWAHLPHRCILCRSYCDAILPLPCEKPHYVHPQCYEYQLLQGTKQTSDCIECILCLNEEDGFPGFIGGVSFGPHLHTAVTVVDYIPPQPSSPTHNSTKKIAVACFLLLLLLSTITLLLIWRYYM